MSPSRAPMQPPELPGFEHVRLVGSGGYSDVFLYEQQMPRRMVAIKVLLTEARDDEGRQQFFDEANAMASVSTHPYIVSVFHADVSPEGHPYLVMEYYPRDNFSVRARNEQIPVFEALRVGIQVASAVETAHRAGILHRDIKPANILTSEYDRPGLTDFGIATASASGREAEGMSIPWSPPEVVNGSAPGDVTADVYSLAATVHTLLSGRSPFELPGASNRSFDLIPRIEAGGPQPTGRADVPESVERILRHGMSRSAGDRPGSAAEFARMLQSAEVELGLTPTQLEIRQDPRDVRARGGAEDDDGTRLKGPRVIRSQSETGPGPAPLVTGAPGGGAGPGAQGRSGWDGSDAGEGTVQRGSAPGGSGAGMISGVGARPVGLSGAAAPRPVAPMPSAHGAGRSFDPSDVGADAHMRGEGSGRAGRAAGRSVSWPKVAVSAFVGVAVLVVVGFAFSGGQEAECDPGEPGCGEASGSSGASPLPPPTALPDPVTVPELVDAGPGAQQVRWIHELVDLGSVEYEIVDGSDTSLATLAGDEVEVVDGPVEGVEEGMRVLSATLTTEADCLKVRARPPGGAWTDLSRPAC